MSDTNKRSLDTDTQKLLHSYFCAAHNLYGIIPLRKLLSIYNSQNEPITEEQFLEFIDTVDFEKEYFDIIGDDEVYDDVSPLETMDKNLVSEYIYTFGDWDDYCNLQERQFGISYYVPPKEKLLKYEDEFYFEKTPEYIRLRAFLRNLPEYTKEQADDIAMDLQDGIKIDDKPEPERELYFLPGAGESRIKISSQYQYNEFCRLYCDMFNHSRLHIYCGHTPAEVFKM